MLEQSRVILPRLKVFSRRGLFLVLLVTSLKTAAQGEYPANTVFFDVTAERQNVAVPASSALLDLKVAPAVHESSNELELVWKCKSEAPIKKTFLLCNVDLNDLEFENKNSQTRITMKLYTAANFQLRDQETFEAAKKKKADRKNIRMTCFSQITPKTFDFPICK